MAAENPFRFRRLILCCSVFVALVVAFDLVVLVAHRDTGAALPALLLSTALGLVAVLTIGALVVTGRRTRQHMRQILAGDYLVRWHYAPGEWHQFVTLERTRRLRAALLFLPLTLACAALLVLLSQVVGDSLLGEGIPVLLLLAAGFLLGLLATMASRSADARRARLVGDTYISPLGVIRPDGYRALHRVGYHLAAVVLERGAPSRLRFLLRPGRVMSLLGLLSSLPGQLEVAVPVPAGHEAEAAQVAAQLEHAGSPREPGSDGRS